jgi:hypothetical protein
LLKICVWKNDGRLEGCSEMGDVARRVQDCSCRAAQVPDEDWPCAFCGGSVCGASLRTGECDLDLVRTKPGRLSESGPLWWTMLPRCFKCFDVFSRSASTSAFSVSILSGLPLGDERTDELERFSVGSFLASRRLLTLCVMSNWLKHKGIARPGRSLYYR